MSGNAGQWDSDLSSIIEKTNNNLKLLRKIGDKPRAADVSTTAGAPVAAPGRSPPRLARSSTAGSSHSRYDDTGSVSSHASARPRAFVRNDDDGSVSSRSSAKPRAFVRNDDDGSVSSRSSQRPRAFIRADDDNNSASSRTSAKPRAFIRAEDDNGSVSSRSSARPRAFVRGDDDTGSVSSRASARPRAFVRGDDDNGSVSSRSSQRPRAFIRGDSEETGSMSSATGSNRPSVGPSARRVTGGIAGGGTGGGLTAAMLQQRDQQHAPNMAQMSLGEFGRLHEARFSSADPHRDETRSMTGSVSSRLSRRMGANGRVPHARPLGASMGPGVGIAGGGPARIRVPDADIPSDIPTHIIEEIKKSLETHFASRNAATDKKVSDLRSDFAGLNAHTSALNSQLTELRNAVATGGSGQPVTVTSTMDPKVLESVTANTEAIMRLEQHSAVLLGRKVSVDQELQELAARMKGVSSLGTKLSTLEDNMEAVVAGRSKADQAIDKVSDKVKLMERQMSNLVDMKAVENLLSIRLTREFREMEDRMTQNVALMAEKMEAKIQALEKQSNSQRQDSMATLKNDLMDDIQRLQSSGVRKTDLMPLQNAQAQLKEDVSQLTSSLERQEKKVLDAKATSASLRDELADAKKELAKSLQDQTGRVSSALEEKLEELAKSSKEKTSKLDDQITTVAKTQKKVAETIKLVQENVAKIKAESLKTQSLSLSAKDDENEKLRQRLSRTIAELETLETTKTEVERRFAKEEEQFQGRLKELRAVLVETEKEKETQRLELMQKLQEESKLMGVAQGKNSLLETLLAREKAENDEKTELVRKSKKEVAEVREKIRSLESEKEKRVRQLSSELQAKQTQVGLLTKTLQRIETASAKMLDLSKREAKTVRRVKATKEHELFIAQLKLKEMERVAQALQNGDELKEQAALTAATADEREQLEKLLLESQLEKDELKQELKEMSEEFKAAKESQKVAMEDTITKLSSDYDEKINDLKQQIADKEQAMRDLRDTLVEKSNLDALEDELTALKDEKNDLVEQMQRAQIEHERVALKTETNLRLEHATEFAEMKGKMEARIAELEGAQAALEASKASIMELEKELELQESVHQREVSALTQEIKDARAKIDECTSSIQNLEETKAHLESEVSQLEANIEGASAEKEDQVEELKKQMQSEVDKLQTELAEVSRTLEEKHEMLEEAKKADSSSRQKLMEMAMAQEEMETRYVAQMDSLSLKLDQERESSRAREQDMESTIEALNTEVKSLKESKDKSEREHAKAREELSSQMTELTAGLKASQSREQKLQSRLQRILEELVHAANPSANDEDKESVDVDDDSAITRHLDALYATHRQTAQELERLQAEYELTVKQATADSATAQELENQVKEHESQIRDLESVVEQLRNELKDQYAKSALISQDSGDINEEMASLREEKRELERQIEEEERDREKREVSYQRRTDAKERELEELRQENKSMAASVSAIREKMKAVENSKRHKLDAMYEHLKELEARSSALQPDESSCDKLEKDFTATRQEIVALTSEVQSLYQKLSKSCGILEWTELHARVFDEEEKLARVRADKSNELAKVRSTEQEILLNAEFLNALLVAHGSKGGDDSENMTWMQKYAALAPEIVQKLRKVESQLRKTVLSLDGDASSIFIDGAAKDDALETSELAGNDGKTEVKSDANADADADADTTAAESVPAGPSSQHSSVDSAAIAMALSGMKEDYFSGQDDEGEDGMDEVERQLLARDSDQPDMERDGDDHEQPANESESGDAEEGAGFDDAGADSDGDAVEDDSAAELSADLSRDEESGACDNELEVAERMLVRDDEQERSCELEEEDATSLATSDLEDEEESSADAAEWSVASTPPQPTTWNSRGFDGGEDRSEDEGMDEVERLMREQSLERSSSPSKPISGDDNLDDGFEASSMQGADASEDEDEETAVEQDTLTERSFDDAELSGCVDDEASASLDGETVQEQAGFDDADDGGGMEEQEAVRQEALDESLCDGDVLDGIIGVEQEDAAASSDEGECSGEQATVEGETPAESSFDEALLSEDADDEASTSVDEMSASQGASFVDGDGTELPEMLRTGLEEDTPAENSFGDACLSESEGDVGPAMNHELASPAAADAEDALAESSLDGADLSECESDVAPASGNDAASTADAEDAERPGGQTLLDQVGNSFNEAMLSELDEETSGSMNATDHTEANDAEAVESSEEETAAGDETYGSTSQALPSFSASLGKFGMGGRLVLEEDDDMDEVERLLLEQSTSSMKQQSNGTAGAEADDDDDEFGEISMQSNGDGDGDGDASTSRGDFTICSSPTRIPIFNGSTLTDRVESRMSSPTRLDTSPKRAAAYNSASEAEQDYLDESFDLDESVQDDEEEETHG